MDVKVKERMAYRYDTDHPRYPGENGFAVIQAYRAGFDAARELAAQVALGFDSNGVGVTKIKGRIAQQIRALGEDEAP